MIGGRSNAIVVIRKRKSSPRNLMEERRAPILQLDQPNEIQITISNGERKEKKRKLQVRNS